MTREIDNEFQHIIYDRGCELLLDRQSRSKVGYATTGPLCANEKKADQLPTQNMRSVEHLMVTKVANEFGRLRV